MKRCDGADEATRHAWFEPGKEVDGQRPSPVLIRDGKKPRQSWAHGADVVDKDINAVKGLDGLGYQGAPGRRLLSDRPLRDAHESDRRGRRVRRCASRRRQPLIGGCRSFGRHLVRDQRDEQSDAGCPCGLPSSSDWTRHGRHGTSDSSGQTRQLACLDRRAQWSPQGRFRSLERSS